MKLWLVLVVLGKVAGTAGPLDSGLDACMVVAERFNQVLARSIERGEAKKDVTLLNTRNYCVHSPERPELGSPGPVLEREPDEEPTEAPSEAGEEV